MAILQDQSAELARLRAENEALKAKMAAKQTITFKVSEKGALSVYGLQRWPVTLYKQQWVRLVKAMPQLEAFISANDGALAEKE